MEVTKIKKSTELVCWGILFGTGCMSPQLCKWYGLAIKFFYIASVEEVNFLCPVQILPATVPASLGGDESKYTVYLSPFSTETHKRRSFKQFFVNGQYLSVAIGENFAMVRLHIYSVVYFSTQV
jgi:hypothetical protein